MPEVQRWVVVTDEPAKAIVGGPYLWDGETEWQPPEAGTTMLEADALAAGYAYPSFPSATQNWVTVNSDTMAIVAGPYAWDGSGDSPGPDPLMLESDALAAGYTYPQV
jgi:hypothetical protein